MAVKSSSDSNCRKLLVASCICFGFMAFELFAGWYAGSLAIMTDAAHMLSDLCSFGISLVALYLARLPPSNALTFGYQRVEMLGAFLSILVIWLLTLWLVIEAISRIWRPTPVKAPVMIVTGVFGLISNVALALVLSGGGHHHHHGGSGHHHHHHHHHHHGSQEHEERMLEPYSGLSDDGPQSSRIAHYHGNSAEEDSSRSSDDSPLIPGNAVEGYKRAGEVLKRFSQHSAVAPCSKDDLRHVASSYIEVKDGDEAAAAVRAPRNVNVWAAYLHTLGDMVQNVGVIIAGVIIHFRPTWMVADPICTVLFAVIVVYTTLELIQEALVLLMEGTPQNISAERVGKALRQVSNVKDLHDLHIWSLAPGTPALACHLVVDKPGCAEEVLEKATQLVQRKFGVLHTTIQVDSATNKAACETDAHCSCQKNQ